MEVHFYENFAGGAGRPICEGHAIAILGWKQPQHVLRQVKFQFDIIEKFGAKKEATACVLVWPDPGSFQSPIPSYGATDLERVDKGELRMTLPANAQHAASPKLLAGQPTTPRSAAFEEVAAHPCIQENGNLLSVDHAVYGRSVLSIVKRPLVDLY